MPYKELLWKGKKYQEDDTVHARLYNVLRNNRRHFFEGNKVAFFLIAFPPFDSGYKREEMGAAIDDFKHFIEDRTRHRPGAPPVVLLDSPDQWGGGCLDYSETDDFFALLSELLICCERAPIKATTYQMRGQLKKGVDTISDCFERINEDTSINQPSGNTEEFYACLFIISEKCYKFIQSINYKLPKMIAGVVEYCVPEALMQQRLSELSPYYHIKSTDDRTPGEGTISDDLTLQYPETKSENEKRESIVKGDS